MNNAHEAEIPPPLARVLSKLKGVRHDGELQYQARCPAHDDREPSLSISWGNGKVVLYDHAGCEPTAILDALGMAWADLEQPRKVVAKYDYTDEAGKLLYQVLRYEPKAFSQRRPNPEYPRAWLDNMKDVDAVPFHLPELVDAVRYPDETIYIVEGEKNVLAMELAYNVTATTNHGGAGKWGEAHSRYCIGAKANFIITADRDHAGYVGAIKTYDSLLEVAGIQAAFQLSAVGNDPADHVGDHGLEQFVPKTLQEMIDLKNEETVDATAEHAAKVAEQVEWLKVNREARAIASAEGWEPPPPFGTLQEQLSNERAVVVWLIDQLAFVGANVLVNAVAKSGKTVLILNVIRSLLSGDPLFGYFPVCRLQEGSVVWWNAELTETQALGWLEQMDFADRERFFPEHLRGFSIPLETPAGEEWAVARLKAQNCKIWFLDPKSALFMGEENSATETGAWLSAIDRIKRRAGVETLFVVHHASETSDMDDPDDKALRLVRGRGSTRMEGWADVLWSYTGRFDEPRYLSALGRDVDVPPFGGIHMTSSTKALRWNGATVTPSEDRKNTRMLEAYDALAAAGQPMQTSDLYAQMAGAKRDVKSTAIALGVERGYITRAPGPGNRTLYSLGERNPRTIHINFTTGETSEN